MELSPIFEKISANLESSAGGLLSQCFQVASGTQLQPLTQRPEAFGSNSALVLRFRLPVISHFESETVAGRHLVWVALTFVKDEGKLLMQCQELSFKRGESLCRSLLPTKTIKSAREPHTPSLHHRIVTICLIPKCRGLIEASQSCWPDGYERIYQDNNNEHNKMALLLLCVWSLDGSLS